MTNIIGDQGSRKSIFNPDLGNVLKKDIEERKRKDAIEAGKKKLEGKGSEEQTQNPESTTATNNEGLIYIPSETYMNYFSGLQYLQQKFVADGKVQPTITHNKKIIPVALSLEEILKARIQGYKLGKTEEEKFKLFNLYFWTGDGIAYQKETKKNPNPPFKLVKQSRDLGLLDANKTHIDIDYSSIVGTELERDGSKYGELLKEREVLEHPTWTGLVSKNVLEEYVPICFKLLFDKFKRNTGMRSYLQSPLDKDTLRSVYVSNLGSSSNAGGNGNLGNSASFLRVTRAPKNSPVEMGVKE